MSNFVFKEVYPPKKRQSQLPAILELENALQHVKFLKVKGNAESSKSGVRVHSFGPGISSSNTSMEQRRLVSDSLKKDAEDRRMKYIYIRQYDMQTNWLKLLDKVIAEDLTW